MLFRFCLYGFLKNQQYYEPFLILVFREKGLSFLQIGLLVGFREICLNLFEIPSGAVADLY
ncbi:MAG: MFS transporter, partial [Victivallales bacterium]|nr:MFS transporter [Victivallales bacterium]